MDKRKDADFPLPSGAVMRSSCFRSRSIKLPVILVHYRRPELLERCVETIRSSSDLAADIVVVDNSREALARTPEGTGYLRGGPELGYGGGINYAVRHCGIKEKYFLAANTDLEFHPAALIGLVEVAWRAPRAGILGPALYVDPEFNRSAPVYALDWRRYLFVRTAPPADDAPHTVDYVDGAAMLVKTEIFRAVGGLDERFFLYCEDTDLSMRIRQAGYECLRVPCAKVFHVGHASTGKISALSLYHGLRSSLYFIGRYCPKGARGKVSCFVVLEAFRRAGRIGPKRVMAALAGVADFITRRTGPEPAWIRGSRR